MNDSRHQDSDRGGSVPERGSRDNGKSSDERDNSTARTLQHCAISCTACGTLINKGRNSKSTADCTSSCPMNGSIRTRLTPPVDQICLSLPQNAVPSTPEAHEVLRLASPPQSVPMQRGRAYYVPPCAKPPTTGGITVTAGPNAAPEYDAGGPFSSAEFAQSHSLGQIPASQLSHLMSRHLNGAANGFLDHDENQGQIISSTPYYPEYQDDYNQASLPPVLSYRQRSGRREPFRQGLVDTSTTCSEHRGPSSRALPARNPFIPSRSGSPSVFPIAVRPSDA